MEPEAIPLVAKQVCKLLVERKYRELAAASGGVRLSAEGIREAIEEIGLPLVMPSERTWEDLDTTAVPGSPGRFSVVFDLWTTAGRSDRSVELTLYTQGGRPVIEVDGIQAL